MTRPHDWPERLAAVITGHEATPYELGRSDCFTFAMACVEAVTGADPSAGKRRAYKTMRGALKAAGAAGYDGMPGILASIAEPIPTAWAGRGDLAIVRAPDGGDAFAVCEGALFVGRAPVAGLQRINRSDVTQAYRLP
jgi:hypothetical protein